MAPDQNKKVLAVDDSMTNNVLLEAVLNNKGYVMYTVLNAGEAYKILEKNHIDLIVLDLLMPEISGLDFLQQIKSHNATKQIPVMIVSAVSDPETKHQAKELGADEYLNKPVDIDQFIKKVDHLIEIQQ